MYKKTVVSRERQRCPDYSKKSKHFSFPAAFFVLGLSLKVKVIQIMLSVHPLSVRTGDSRILFSVT